MSEFVDQAHSQLNLTSPRHYRRNLLVLSVLVAVVYGQSITFGFVDYDDGDYVFRNREVLQGLNLETIQWSLFADIGGNWHPVTWWTHLADSSIWGTWTGGRHLTNVLLHLAATLLLYGFVERLRLFANGSSLWIAALFAVHPLHVESVAWISERKDVTLAVFWMLTLHAWLWYRDKRGIGRLFMVYAAYLAALASKPMAVTLPAVLVLVDCLCAQRDQFPLDRRTLLGMLKDKAGLLVPTVGLCLITYEIQQSIGAMKIGVKYSFGLRLENAIQSYCTYLRQAVVPVDLCVLYPHPGEDINHVYTVVAALVLIAMSGGILYLWRRGYASRLQLLIGWLWYLGTLVPVVGLVQVGAQSHADRYTYLPYVGLWIMLASAPMSLVWLRRVGITSVAVFVFVAILQVQHWRDTDTLFANLQHVNGTAQTYQ